jgi:dolichyl-phosphate-mannose--protein O-mannosyl transferase
MKNIPALLAALLLLFMGILAGGAALRESITMDEVAHIGAGVSYLQKLDMRMNVEHPPLAKVLAAIPLIIRGVRADYLHNSWPFSNRLFGSILGEWCWGHDLALRWNDPRSTVLWARVPMLLLTLVLGLFVYRCASELGGSWGGLLCVAAYATTPAFLVFGPLVLTDVAVTFFALLTLWSSLRYDALPAGAALLFLAYCLVPRFLPSFRLACCLFVSWCFG